MHLVFERSQGRFKSNCNILALAWTPYYEETKFRLALFDYHQRQLINLTSSIAANGGVLGQVPARDRGQQQQPGSRDPPLIAPRTPSGQRNNNVEASGSSQQPAAGSNKQQFLNSRLAELHQRYVYLRQSAARQSSSNQENAIIDLSDDKSSSNNSLPADETIAKELEVQYGRQPDFGWLVVGNVGKIVGVTLTSLKDPPPQPARVAAISEKRQVDGSKGRKNSANKSNGDLMQFNEAPSLAAPIGHNQASITEPINLIDGGLPFRPDTGTQRSNYNLRGHLDEIILVKWNELYQKLATVDSKGNVLIWCKVNEKFSVQTPFYNRSKSVADFKWSNDGKTALICYTDSFILVGSSSGQRHWHSMLNLEDYHITCASWTPNDEQLLLGVSNGNIVVIDLPRSELTELALNQATIRAMCWSSCDANFGQPTGRSEHPSDGYEQRRASSSSGSSRRNSTVVNYRRLTRDCSVFSRHRFSGSHPPIVSGLGESSNNQPAEGRQSPETSGGHQQQTRDLGAKREEVSGSQLSNGKQKQRNVLAIDLANNTIKLYEGGLDDPEPRSLHVNLESYIMSWSSDGQYLAVAGFNIHTTAPSVGCLRCRYLNAIKFYNQSGQLIHEHTLNYTRYPITAFTWAHEDRRLFVATGPRLHCAKVFAAGSIPSLSLLAMSCLQQNTRLSDKSDLLEQIGLTQGWQMGCRSHRSGGNEKLLRLVLAKRLQFIWQSHNCPLNLSPKDKTELDPTSGFRLNGRSLSSEKLLNLQLDNQLVQSPTTTCNNSNVFLYHLPLKLQTKIDELFSQTIRQPYDGMLTLSDIIWQVPRNDQRHYCTLVCYASDRELQSAGYQYRTNLISNNHSSSGSEGRRSDSYTDDSNGLGSTDQSKIFVLYVEFQGSLIPILRARRVGFLKPEFVIFNPESGQSTRSHRLQQRKVSDLSQQSSSTMMMQPEVAYMSAQVNKTANNYNFGQQLQSAAATSMTSQSYHYSNEGFSDQCPDNLHLYSEARASSSSIGRQSAMSDAEHYYNFDSDCGAQSSSFARTPQHPAGSRLAAIDLVNDRSHHQEPIALPMNNPYLLYMASLATGTPQKIQGKGPIVMPSPIKRSGNHQVAGRSIRSTNYSTQHAALSESNELIRIKSNIWGTKFKLINVGNQMLRHGSVLGAVVYKASILHLQPRQIFLNIKDMSNYCCLCSKHHHGRLKNHANSTKSGCERQLNDPSIHLLNSPIELPPSHLISSTKSAKATPRKQKKADESDEDRVFVRVADSIRIAPKLEENQQYRFAGEYPNSMSPNRNDKPSTFRATSKANNRQLSNWRGSNLSSSSETHRSKVAIGHHRSNIHSDIDKLKMRGSENNVSATPQADDDVLTLSLWQGDQMKVEMSSVSQQSSSVDRNNNYNNSSSSNSVQKKLETPSMDQFLASNKTLKSIQTITKMIVDLSSKADSEETELDPNLLPSPSKITRTTSGNTSPAHLLQPEPTTSRRFVAPDTPIHRPRRVAAGAGLNGPLPVMERSVQSACSTPLRSSRHSRRGRRHRERDRKLVSAELPEPPPPVPIGRRLSSSAKRFFDGSLRSLYGSTGLAAPSDPEPDESRPLVSGSAAARRLPRNYSSQPNSPLKTMASRRPLFAARELVPAQRLLTGNSDNKTDFGSLRAQLLSRILGPSAGCQPRASSLAARRSRPSSSLNSSGLELNEGQSSPSASSSSSSSSGSSSSISSSCSSDSDTEGDESYSHATRLRKFLTSGSSSKQSTSVKDLRESGQTSKATKRQFEAGERRGRRMNSGGDRFNVGVSNNKLPKQQEPMVARRRLRRKSMCPNENCCCAREFKLNNRPPVWNEQSQVYQLDFGGRVTQESAKNLQIDHEGKLALQFGRIDRCTYTLDYKFPFNAVQAMAIALASLTQRLK